MHKEKPRHHDAMGGTRRAPCTTLQPSPELCPLWVAVQTPSGCWVQARLSPQAPQASLLTRLSELPKTHTPATSGPLPALSLERTIQLKPQHLPELFLTRLPEQAYSLLLPWPTPGAGSPTPWFLATTAGTGPFLLLLVWSWGRSTVGACVRKAGIRALSQTDWMSHCFSQDFSIPPWRGHSSLRSWSEPCLLVPGNCEEAARQIVSPHGFLMSTVGMGEILRPPLPPLTGTQSSALDNFGGRQALGGGCEVIGLKKRDAAC